VQVYIARGNSEGRISPGKPYHKKRRGVKNAAEKENDNWVSSRVSLRKKKYERGGTRGEKKKKSGKGEDKRGGLRKKGVGLGSFISMVSRKGALQKKSYRQGKRLGEIGSPKATFSLHGGNTGGGLRKRILRKRLEKKLTGVGKKIFWEISGGRRGGEELGKNAREEEKKLTRKKTEEPAA